MLYGTLSYQVPRTEDVDATRKVRTVTGKRWLVIGGSGYVGSHLRRRLGGAALATFNSVPFPGGIRFDGRVDRLADRVLALAPGIEAAFILQGISNIDACARDPLGSHAVNVEAVVRIVEDLATAGIVPVFTSTDGVLDGKRHLVDETEPARPLMSYGRQKAEIEAYLAAQPMRSITVRLSKVVGTDRHASNMLSGWLDQIERGGSIKCASDQIFCPILAADVAETLLRLVEYGGRGLYNLGGPAPLGRREFLDLLIAEAARYREVSVAIETCRLNDLPFLEPRPVDQSMSIAKLVQATGWQPTEMAEVCRRIAAERYGPAA